MKEIENFGWLLLKDLQSKVYNFKCGLFQEFYWVKREKNYMNNGLQKSDGGGRQKWKILINIE